MVRSRSVDAPRRLAGAALDAALRDSRATTLTRTLDLSDDQWQVPERAGVNPIAWELGHLAWFAEFWILRGPHRLRADGLVDAARPPLWSGSDALFDSARLAHTQRWRRTWPCRSELQATLADQLEACIEAIADRDKDAGGSGRDHDSHGGTDSDNDGDSDSDADACGGTHSDRDNDHDSDRELYAHRLALFHEDMHGEAFAWLRAALGLPAPAGLEAMPVLASGSALAIPGGEVEIGRAVDSPGFAFDNEQPAERVRLAASEIDSAPVTAGEFLRFVEAGGYADDTWWPGPAGLWRAARGTAHPERWRRSVGGRWQMRWFDRWLPLELDAPVVHVSAWEAEAYCAWAGRRLPSAAQWERAAAEPRFRWGKSVWEWTADAFVPYEGFVAGPYRDYSLPWFCDHRELRGGSFATHARLHHPSYRNFFVADRTDVFAGFRTAAAST